MPRACAWLALVGLLLLLQGGCSTVPVTGRQALNLVADADVVRLSAEAFAELKAFHPISHDPRLNAMVQRVSHRIADAALFDVPAAEWEFVVFDNPASINAFAMAGGKVGVFSGLFQVVRSDADLAVVLAHEIAHVAARHTHERLSRQVALAAGGGVVAVLASSRVPHVSMGTVLDLYGLGSTVGVALPYDRRMELEADEIGLIYMARAGYDPRTALDFWERMAAVTAAEGRTSEFLSTHPSPDNRMGRLSQVMPAALREYEAAKVLGVGQPGGRSFHE
jgi:metalloendopeptidase OMA1, mitochondrial